MSNPTGGQGGKKGLSTQSVILIIVLALLVCGTVIAAVLLLNKEPEPVVDPNAGTLVLTEDNVVEIMEEVGRRVEEGRFETYMNTRWAFPDGESPSSNAVMGNSDANRYPFYFTVTLANESEPIFTSGLLPVGTQIGEIVLERDLDAGEYAAVVQVHMVNDEGNPVEGNMGFNIALVIAS